MSASPAMQSFERAWAARATSTGGAGADSPMQAQRAAAMARFTHLGLPTPCDESWHYSNLRALGLRSFHVPAAAPAAAPARSWLEDPGDFQVVHLVNGVPLAAGLIAHGPLQLQSLRALEHSDPAGLAALSPAPSDAETQRWLLLNTAVGEDGLLVRIGGACQRPLLLVHHAVPAEPSALLSPRVIIEVQAQGSGVILEHHLGAGAGAALLCNSAAHIRLQAGAKLEHYRLFSQAGHATQIDHLQVRLAADAHLLQHTAVLGGGFVRATLEAALEAPGASLDSHTLLTGHESRHTDCVNLVTHAAPHTQSRQMARLIAADKSRAIFNSKVTVAKGAQKADSLQSCRGLLLSAGAEIDTRPQLEIHADDVKCAHGATTGRLDPDMLFYLLSRGLDRRAAQSLLVFAFLADVLTPMSRPAVRAVIESQLINLLPDSHTLQQFR